MKVVKWKPQGNQKLLVADKKNKQLQMNSCMSAGERFLNHKDSFAVEKVPPWTYNKELSIVFSRINFCFPFPVVPLLSLIPEDHDM